MNYIIKQLIEIMLVLSIYIIYTPIKLILPKTQLYIPICVRDLWVSQRKPGLQELSILRIHPRHTGMDGATSLTLTPRAHKPAWVVQHV